MPRAAWWALGVLAAAVLLRTAVDVAARRVLYGLFPGRLTCGSLDVFPAADVHGLVFRDEHGQPLVSVRRLHAGYNLLALWGAPHPAAAVRDVRVERPEVVAELTGRKGPDLTPLLRQLRRALDAYHGRVTVDDGEVRMVDARSPAVTRRFTALHAVLDRRDPKTSTADVDARAGRTRWHARATWGSRLERARVALDLDGFDLPFWSAWAESRRLVPLPKSIRATVRRGALSAHLGVQLLGRMPRAPDDVDIDGTLSLRGLQVDVAAGGRELAVRDADGDFHLGGQQLRIDRLAVATDLGAARLHGRILGLSDPQLDLRATLTCPSLARAARSLHLKAPVDGPATLVLHALGGMLAPRVSGRLEIPWLAVRGQRGSVLRGLTADFGWHDGVLEITRCAARCGHGALALHGWILPDPAARNASLLLMAQARHATLPPALGFAGARASVRATILGSLTDPVVAADVACDGLRLGAGRGLPTLSAVSGRFLALRSGALFDDVRAQTSAGMVAAPAGVVDLAPGRRGPALIRHLSAAVEAHGLEASVPGYGSVSRGGFEAFVSGTPTRWIAAGAAEAARVAAPQGALQDLAAAFVASPQAVRLTGARFRWLGMPFHAAASATRDGEFEADLASSAFDGMRAAASRGVALPGLPGLSGPLVVSACGSLAEAVVAGGLASPDGSFSWRAAVRRAGSAFALLRGDGVDVGRLTRALRLPEAPRGTLQVQAAVRAPRMDQAAFAVDATSRSLRVRGVPIRRLAATGSYTGGTLRLRHAVLESPLAWALAWGSARPSDRSYRIHWQAAVRRLGSLATALASNPPGEIIADRLTGPKPPPPTAGWLPPGMLRGGSVSASGTVVGRGPRLVARIDDGRATLGPSEVDFAGRARLGRRPWLSLRAALRDLDLSALQPFAAGTMSGTMRVAGAFPKLVARGTLAVAAPYLSVPGLTAAAAAQMHFDRAVLQVHPQGGRTFVDLAATRGATRVEGHGSGDARGYTFDGLVRGFPLRGLLASAAGRDAAVKPLEPVLDAARADADLHVAGRGAQLPDARLGLAVRLPRERWTLLDGRARFTGRTRIVDLERATLHAPASKGRATLSGRFQVPPRWPARPVDLEGALRGAELAFHAFPLRGALDEALHMERMGPAEAVRIAARLLRPEKPSTSPLQPVLNGDVKLTSARQGSGTLTVAGLGHGAATVQGSWAGAQGEAHLTASRLDLSLLHELYPQIAATGTATADLHLEKDAGPPGVEGSVSLARPVVQGVALGNLALQVSRKQPVYTLVVRSQALGGGTVSWNQESGELQGTGTDGARGKWTIDAGPAGPSYLASLNDAQVYLYGDHLHSSVRLPGSGPASLSVQLVRASAVLHPRLKFYELSLTDPTIELTGTSSADPSAALERFARLDFLHLPDRTELAFHMDRSVIHGSPLPPTSGDYTVGAPNLLYGYTWLDTPVGRISLDRHDEDPHVTHLIRHLILQLKRTPPSDPVRRIQLELHLATLRREVEPPRVGLRARQQELQSKQSPELGNVLLYAPARNMNDTARFVQTGKESVIDLVNNVTRSIVPPDVAQAEIKNSNGVVSRFFLQLFHDSGAVPIPQPVEAYGAGYRLGPLDPDNGKPIGELRQSVQAWYDSLNVYHVFYQIGLPFLTGRKK